jgi:formate-dependent nitrite reductase membrane component NrfD
MHELDITRNNHLIDPSLHIWGWQVPVYLFFGGLVAGMMLISGYFLLKGKCKDNYYSCTFVPLIAIIALSIGMFALFLDLEYKVHVWRMYTTFQITSPMSWGSWILLLVYPALVANLLVNAPEFLKTRFPVVEKISARIHQSDKLIKAIGGLNIALGGMLGIYTGILLSAFGARPLWNSSVLGVLFIASGLSSAAAYIHMVSSNREESKLLAKADNGFLTGELIIFLLYFIGMLTTSESHINAAKILLTGPFAPFFWVFVIGTGIVIPLILQNLAVRGIIKHSSIPPVMVITGGLILRFVIVYAGQYSAYSTAVLGR